MAGLSVARVGDTVTTTDACNAPGTTVMASGSMTVLVNGKSVCRIGDLTAGYPSGIPPVCINKIGVVTTGIPNILVNGKQIATVGSVTTAGPIATGSLDVLA